MRKNRWIAAALAVVMAAALWPAMAFASDEPVITNLAVTRDSETTATFTFDSSKAGSAVIVFKSSNGGALDVYLHDKDGVSIGRNTIMITEEDKLLSGTDGYEIAVYYVTDESAMTSIMNSQDPFNEPGAVKGTVPAVHTCASTGGWQSDDTNHWKLCDTCKKEIEKAAHSGGTATCAAKAVCTACGAEYGKVNASNHTNLVNTEAKAATHLAAGNKEYWHCGGCNKYFSDEAGTKEIALADTVIPKLEGHTADGTGWKSDETNHWEICACGEILNKAAHAFAWVTDKAATATEAGSKHEECTVCHYK